MRDSQGPDVSFLPSKGAYSLQTRLLRRVWASLWVWMCLSGMACGPGKASERNLFPLQKKIHQQLTQSARQATSYHKTVTNYSQTPAGKEQITFEPIPWLDSTLATPKNSLLHQELSYVWESYFSDPELIEQFEISRVGDSIIAKRTSAYEDSPGLASQTWVVLEADSTVLYFASHQQQQSWLYANDIALSIQFDSNGTYLHHQLNIQSRVPLLQQNISARIQGQTHHSP